MQDIEYLKSMYPSRIRILQGYVAEACDRLDYKNSPMYDEYPDHMMINRLCDTICDTVIASEGAQKVRGMWNISENDKAVMEMAELKKDMKRLDADLFTEDDDAQMEQDLENAPAENIGEADVSTTEESQEELSDSNIHNEFRGYRESVVNPTGIIMETQEMRGREPGFPGNGGMGGRPNMGQGADRPPMGNNPGRPPMGPGPERPPMGPGPDRPPMGPGPDRPPMGPGPVIPPSGPNQDRPPVGGPGPVRPPQPPRPTPPPPRPPQPPRPPRPVPPLKHGNRPSWLRDMVKVLLLNEMFHRRCARGLCAL
ncbi:MAG: hypothetical protein LUK37_22330 [Clostridia bacterium]|nr:hypothetical protein [Clostridia bacterium]